ncbi:MAG: hypothetical protein H0T18_06580 [Chloroflexia bacterium]|nr:hypothetical protein [Chloroflexia bacterium]
MSDRAIDVISRRAADALSRRSSLLALTGLALAAAMPASTAQAGKKGKKNRGKGGKKNNGVRLCQDQVANCRSFFAGFCTGIDGCVEEFAPCCDSLATCNPAGMLTCLFACGCTQLNDLATNVQQQQ